MLIGSQLVPTRAGRVDSIPYAPLQQTGRLRNLQSPTPRVRDLPSLSAEVTVHFTRSSIIQLTRHTQQDPSPPGPVIRRCQSSQLRTRRQARPRRLPPARDRRAHHGQLPTQGLTLTLDLARPPPACMDDESRDGPVLQRVRKGPREGDQGRPQALVRGRPCRADCRRAVRDAQLGQLRAHPR